MQIESYIDLSVGFQGNVLSSDAMARQASTSACLNMRGALSSNRVGTRVQSVLDGLSRN